MTLHLLQEFRDVGRLRQIALALIRCELGFLVSRLGLRKQLGTKQALKRYTKHEAAEPEKIVHLFEQLGGTFTKLGQLLSIRPDLLPKEYCDAFRKLQDDVEPFPTPEAIEIIEHELHKPLHHCFTHFSHRPIASASIGQVYEARLRETGKRVAIKVERPGIRELIATDIDILQRLAHIIEKRYKPQVFDPVTIVKEFRRYTEEELNYRSEAQNIDHFHRNFKADSTTIVPQVHWPYTTDRVLTMDFIDGIKIADLPKNVSATRKKRIVRSVVNSIYKQIFIFGYFHADPHPGNILICKNRIGFLDFGIVGYFDDELREHIIDLFAGLILADLDRTAKSMIRLGFVSRHSDTVRVKRILMASLSRYYDRPLKELNFGVLFHELLSTAKENNMKVPSELVLLGKSIITVDGFARELDPDFNLVAFSKPFVERLARQKVRPGYLARKLLQSSSALKEFVTSFPKQTDMVLDKLESGEKAVVSIDRDMRVLVGELDRSSNRIALGLLITAIAISSSLLYTAQQPKVFSLPFFSAIGFIICGLLVAMLAISVVRERTSI